MSVNLIKVERGHKTARSITSEEEYRRLRNGNAQLANLQQARAGNAEAKRRLIQFNYSGYYPQGVVKGCKLSSQAFGFDVDEPQEFERIKQLLLAPASSASAVSDNKALEPQPKERKESLAEQLGLLMMERSARQGGHCVFLREKGKTILENQVRIASILGCEIDTNAHDINRVYFSTSASPDDLLYLSPRLFDDQYGISPGADAQSVTEEANLLADRERMGREELPPGAHSANKHFKPSAAFSEKDNSEKGFSAQNNSAIDNSRRDNPAENVSEERNSTKDFSTKFFSAKASANPSTASQSPTSNKQALPSSKQPTPTSPAPISDQSVPNYLGIPYSEIIDRWWQMYNNGQQPMKSNRDVLTFELALNLRHICGFDRDTLDQVIPCYDGFPEAQKLKCIDSALGERRTAMPKRLKEVLGSLRKNFAAAIDTADRQDALYYADRLPNAARPMGISDSLDATEPRLAMPVLTAICPAIGMLATGVQIDIHGKMSHLNLIAYIAGDFASGKGSIDPIIAAWMYEIRQQDDIYLQQEAEWREKKRQAKNAKNQPEEPKLPVRFLTLNNTVANLAERLSNAGSKHSFSFTPEADTVALKWKQSISDFSVMLRQAYDASRYDREARSSDAVSVHIPHLRWNVTMCGTPDALYRVVTNYTDGFQSRIAVARTPDNTYAPLALHPRLITEQQQERIHKVAHLLSLLQGEITLPKLEARGRKWLESIRLESIKNDDTIMARQRFRVCVTAQRMTACLMLCRVCEKLISEHGLNGAEQHLKQHPEAWLPLMQKAQTSAMLDAYEVIADSLIDNALFYFRNRINNAMYKSDNRGGDRCRPGKNDSIFARLPEEFDVELAYQQAINVKGNDTSRNSVLQMLKNWRKQGLISSKEMGKFKKLKEVRTA